MNEIEFDEQLLIRLSAEFAPRFIELFDEYGVETSGTDWEQWIKDTHLRFLRANDVYEFINPVHELIEHATLPFGQVEKLVWATLHLNVQLMETLLNL